MGRTRMASRRGWPPNLHQNAAGYFYYRHPHSGKIRGIGRDKQKAFIDARAANAVLATLKKSDLVNWVSGKTNPTLAEWVPIYEAEWISRKKPAASTIKKNEGRLTRIKESDMGWMQLPDITAEHASKFLDAVEKDNGPGAAVNLRSKLSDIFRMAETKGLIEQGKNPVSATYTANYKVKRERLSFEQFEQIRAKAPAWLANAMNLALVTAQRREDVAAMKFADHRDGALFVVQGKGQGRVRLQLDGQIRMAKLGLSINEVVKACRDNVVSAFMVHHTQPRGRAKKGAAVGLNGMTTAFANVRDSLGIEAGDGRTPPSFHEIRSLAERMYREEFGVDFAQAILGHKTAKMTNEYDDLRGSGWQLVAAK